MWIDIFDYVFTMILDAYVPTRGVDFVEVRAITDCDSVLHLTFQTDSYELFPGNYSLGGLHFFRQQIRDLRPGSAYELLVEQAGTESVELQTSTLAPPTGDLLFRFGLVADPHLDTRAIGGSRPLRYTRRMYDQSVELHRKYLAQLEEMGAAFIILPGDIVDPASEDNLALARDIFSSVSTPCYPIIGNHEAYDRAAERQFYRAFDLPEDGLLSFDRDGVRFLLLSTPAQGSLDPGTAQLAWLQDQLRDYGDVQDTLLFSHFSLLLHPCVQGWKNDGFQQLHNHRDVMALLNSHQKVRAFIAGHKNVPSMMMRDGIAHVLCPQLIQAPSSFDVVDVYRNGLVLTVREIEEQHTVQISREAYGPAGWRERYGTEAGRNFVLNY